MHPKIKTSEKASENGQAVVLVMLAIVVLLGFAALAVDGSMVLSDRRYAQTGADAASLAGGGTAGQAMAADGVTRSNWSSGSPTCSGNVTNASNRAKTAAVNQAAANNFTIDKDISDNHGVDTECGTEIISVPNEAGNKVTIFSTPYIDVRTFITSQTKTGFAHLVFQGLLQNTVTSVARVRPSQPLVFGYAIVALNPNTCSGNSNGVGFSGNNTLNVIGGGVFSNGCLDVDGGNHPNIQNGAVNYFYGGNSLGNFTFEDVNGDPIPVADEPINDLEENSGWRIPADAYNVPVPDCSGHTVSASAILGHTGLSGLYCVTGNMSVHNAADSFSGTNMTIVMLGGKLTVNGGNVNVTAPGPGYTGSAIQGVAIYLPVDYYGPSPSSCGNVNQEVKLNGNAISGLVGAVVAPCSDVSVEGGGSTHAFNSQIIGWNVSTSGNAELRVVYNSNNQYRRPSTMDLYR